MPRRLPRFVLPVLGLGIAVLLVARIPDHLGPRADAAAATCLGFGADGTRCRFIGAPIEMAGSPVFVEKFAHAFLPTGKQLDFVDAAGDTWTAPPRTLTDGASIPTIFEPLMGDRQSREYLLAAALHDAYCGVGNEALQTYQTRSWEEVHRMFYEALLVAGTPPRTAGVMYAAVYLGGPRWDDPARALTGISEARLVQEMEWCIEWIEATDPGPGEIEAWMRDREAALKAGDTSKPEYPSRDFR